MVPARFFPLTNYDHQTNLVDEHGLCPANVAACRAFEDSEGSEGSERKLPVMSDDHDCLESFTRLTDEASRRY